MAGFSQNTILNFEIDAVYDAALRAIPALKGFKLVRESKVSYTIFAKTGVTLFSYGENISVSLTETEQNKTSVSVISEPKMGALFGAIAAMEDAGKNQRNIKVVLEAIKNQLK
ncbi:hypothetical protein AGMMS49983_17540 [Clostridia bacterium]|nr:hypothetical protein AGMMS49983_17540 [Clostridia bacterium]